jgi:hypothetical protein
MQVEVTERKLAVIDGQTSTSGEKRIIDIGKGVEEYQGLASCAVQVQSPD